MPQSRDEQWAASLSKQVEVAHQAGRERALAEVRGALIVRESHLTSARSAVVRARHDIADVLDHPDEFGTRKRMLEQAMRELATAETEIREAR